ncbi:MAG: asmA family protein [Verrucomicrobiaceae bacterium]|nr:asmA family protein [Verrucomicrobiaceae bacterium]
MKKTTQRIGIIGGAVVAGFLILIVIAGSFSNWNPARPWINRTVTAAIDRPFSINGDLTLHWVRSVEILHWWLPRPQISAGEIIIGNPDWTHSKKLGEIRHITFVIDPLPLFRHAVILPLIDVEDAHIALERRQNGNNNWTFGKDDAEPSKWRFAPGVLRIHKSSLQLDDAQRQLTLQADADSYAQGIRWTATGTMNKAELKSHGSAGSLLALQDKKTPYPIEFYLDVGSTHISAVGTLSNPSQLAELDVNLKLSGSSMAQLYPLTNIVLPETSAFATQGHLIGTLNEFGGKWRYEKFSGTVGNSDLQGNIVYEARPQRALLTAELISKSLDFADLAPLIGADSNANKSRRAASIEQPADKALPVEPFKTDRWNSIDAHVQFDGKKIIRQEALPIDNLHAVVDLKDGVLKLIPLNFGMAGGELTSTITLDGNKQPMVADIKITPRHLKLKELFPTTESMQASLGEVNGSAALAATGNSIAALLGSSDGEVKLFVDRGTVSKFILEAAGLNIANVVMTKLFGDKQINLNCAAANFKVDKGLMQTQGFIVDTDAALVNVDGNINLADEKLGLTVKPESKSFRILSLRAPLYVNGTFKKPEVSIDKGVVALRGGGAIALGVVAWPAALVPLVSTGTGDSSSNPGEGLPPENGCVQLLSTAKVKAVSAR